MPLPAFNVATLKSWEWPGDEAITNTQYNESTEVPNARLCSVPQKATVAKNSLMVSLMVRLDL